MHDDEQTPKNVLPDNFTSLDEFLEFWDTHSSADFEQSMETVAVEVELTSSKAYMPVAKDLLSKVRAQARRQGVSSETLVNLWLQERLATAG